MIIFSKRLSKSRKIS